MNNKINQLKKILDSINCDSDKSYIQHKAELFDKIYELFMEDNNKNINCETNNSK